MGKKSKKNPNTLRVDYVTQAGTKTLYLEPQTNGTIQVAKGESYIIRRHHVYTRDGEATVQVVRGIGPTPVWSKQPVNSTEVDEVAQNNLLEQLMSGADGSGAVKMGIMFFIAVLAVMAVTVGMGVKVSGDNADAINELREDLALQDGDGDRAGGGSGGGAQVTTTRSGGQDPDEYYAEGST